MNLAMSLADSARWAGVTSSASIAISLSVGTGPGAFMPPPISRLCRRNRSLPTAIASRISAGLGPAMMAGSGRARRTRGLGLRWGLELQLAGR